MMELVEVDLLRTIEFDVFTVGRGNFCSFFKLTQKLFSLRNIS